MSIPSLTEDIAILKSLATEALDRNPGLLLLRHAPAVLRVTKALQDLLAAHDAEIVSSAPRVVERRMKAPGDDGVIKGEDVATRMMVICGCKGRHDCDCVSVQKQARRELWTEYNGRTRHDEVNAALAACREFEACPATCGSK